MKFIKTISLLLLLILSAPLYSSCKNNDDSLPENNINPLTDSEIIQEAKLSLNDSYNFKNIYDDISLIGFIEVEKNKVYINWTSSDNSLVNASNGSVYRDLKSHTCTLSATLIYNNLTEKIDFNYTLPAKKYENPYPSFTSSGSEIQFSVAYLAYDDNNNLTIKLNIYNNLSSKKTLYGITNLVFSITTSKIIFNHTNYLVQNLTYTNDTQKQFTCKYGNYVTITLPVIANNLLTYESELAKISTAYFSINKNFTYHSAQ